MTVWLTAVLVLAQAAQGPVAAPAELARRERATVDVAVQAAMVADVLPRRDTVEVRPRVRVELTATPARWSTVRFDAQVDALLADRGGSVSDLRAEVGDAWIEVRGSKTDVRAGYGRMAWGRLDEIAPTDVVNPIDVSRFLFEGRSEARLPVAFVRGRLTVSERVRVEALLVPVFRRGLFDRLDEPTSPFNLVDDAAKSIPGLLGRERREPAAAWKTVSGGGRVDMTLGRVDVAASLFRGFDGLGPVAIDPPPGGPLTLWMPALVLSHPRFTMVGGDFETVTGDWAWRGEVAAFTEKTFAAGSGIGLVQGRSVDAGIGFDRRAGEFRLFGSGILHREWSSTDPSVERTDVSLVGSIERSFDRERYLSRAFAVVNPGDRSLFLRGLFAWKPRDRVAIEGSGGAFVGSSDDTLGRFKTRDFVLVALRTWLW